jgi:Ca2+-binding EF-hand superfamily protein
MSEREVNMEDSVREFLEKLRKKAIVMTSAAESTLKEAGRKTSETFEIAKLNMKIFDLNSDIEHTYKKLGELVYSINKGREIQDEEVDSLISAIDTKKKEIEQYRERINLLKNTVICPLCQGCCSRDDRFCKKCGAEL